MVAELSLLPREKVKPLRPFKHLAIVAAIGLIQACASGSDSRAQTSPIPMQQNKGYAPLPKESQLRFVLNYEITSTPGSPNGGILVSPFMRQQWIGNKRIAKVELFLFGSDRKELMQPNSQPKGPTLERYYFKLPETFVPGVYPCGTGQYLSEVRVTDVTGFTLSKTFELCPGVAFETSASAP